MKKFLFVLTALTLLTGQCLALYTLTGTVYYAGTTNRVSNASVSLSSVSCTASTTADIYGGFTLQCTGDMGGSSITITATSLTGTNSGQKTWTVQPGTTSQFKKIYISPTIQPYPSLQLPSISAPLLGSPGSLVGHTAPLQIQATGAPVAGVQNVQVNILFDGPIVGPPVVTAPPLDVTITSTVPIPGGVAIGAEVDPPREVPPDFPAESFFDVFFEVEIPESGAELVRMTVEDAIFNPGTADEAEAIPGVTDFLVGDYEHASPYFLVDSQEEWQSKLDGESPFVHIRPLNLEEGEAYLIQLDDFLIEGEPYSPIEPNLPDFIPPGLFIYPGGNDGQSSPVSDPDDAGLVMTWGDDETPDGEKAAAWKWDYGDPDLSNCIITVTATPPGPSGINRISLGMQDVNGNIRSWWWNVPGVIPYNVPTTVTIDTTQTGMAAANPPASGFANNPAFNITQVQSIVADENAAWVSGAGAPAPGGGVAQIWNYWHNLSVTPKSPSGGANSKWYVKWSQPPVVLNEPNDPALIDGWDEVSMTQRLPNDPNTPIMADDWQCDTDRPVTDIHWWGSFKGWTQPTLPPILPTAFHIGIWTDQPDPNPTPGIHDDQDWSHPLTLVWENVCDTSVWNFAGYDLDPRIGDPDFQENEACFQWAQFLSQDEWFHQEEGTNVYWVSIAAIYPANTDFTSPDFYPWGWKTRPHYYNDDAVRIIGTTDGTWPPVLGSTLTMTDCDPIHIGEVSWDLAFELTTNEPAYKDNPIPGDIAGAGDDGLEPDGAVNLTDLAVMAGNWLTIVSIP